MSQLNRPIGQSENDGLIYDGKHPIDATNVAFTNSDSAAGTLERGQILYEKNGAYGRHASEGDPSVIVAEKTDYAEDDATVTVPVYTSGTFRLSKFITSTALSAAGIEKLREKNIIAK